MTRKKKPLLRIFFFEFLCLPIFGTPARTAGGFAKSHESTHNQDFAKKKPNFANAQLISIFVMINWNNYDR
jgi:hypothetical protein